MNRDYLQDALQTYNGTNGINWYGWKTHDDSGNKIPNADRMQYKYLKATLNQDTYPQSNQYNFLVLNQT